MKNAGDLVDGRYLLGREIGRGAHGQVFAAFDTGAQRDVAIKVLNPMLENDDQFVQRLWREARSLAALWGTSVVEVYAFGQDEDDGAVYMVMELLRGETLSDRLDELELFDSRMSAYDVLVVTEPIVRALHTAHKMGIIHRDLKPSNIFIVDAEAGGGSRLMDFGLAKVDDQLALTRAGMVAGSPNYMAPEMLRNEPFDHRIDVYSLAAVIYRALAGQPMFLGDNPTQLLLRVLREPRPPLTGFRPDLPPGVDRWVQEALSLDPSSRYLDVPSMWNALLAFIQRGRNPSAYRARTLSPIDNSLARPRRLRAAASSAAASSPAPPHARAGAAPTPQPPPGVGSPGGWPAASTLAAGASAPVCTPPGAASSGATSRGTGSLGAALHTDTCSEAAAARSPLVLAPSVALPQAESSTWPHSSETSGARQTKEKRTTPSTAGLCSAWVISPRPLAGLSISRVCSPSGPPSESSPDGTLTFRPPKGCSPPVSRMASVKTPSAPGASSVGPISSTAGSTPPLWHLLHPWVVLENLVEATPLGEAQAEGEAIKNTASTPAKRETLMTD